MKCTCTYNRLKELGYINHLYSKTCPMSETNLRNAMLDYLGYKNIYCWLNNTQGNYNKFTNTYYKNPRLRKGIADIIGLMPNGRLLAIECKVGKNKQTESQIEFEKEIIANKGIYILAYDLDELEKKLKQYDN